METLGETLPFFKELFANEEELGLKLLSAAMQEKLPLNRAVLTDLKKGLITVEKQWGLIVHPRALAFLQARSIPLTPRSLLWALYALFPTVQKVLWHKAGTADSLFPDFKREGGEREGRPDHPQTNGPAQKEVPAEICKETVAFLHQQARHDPTLPHFVYYLFPSSQEELRCTGRKFSMSTTDNDKGGNGEEDGFAFALDYQSDFFGPLQITGVYNKLGLNLTIGAEPAVLDRNLLNGLGYYLAEKGWPVRSVQFQTYQERKEELPPIFPPLRIDGWL
jgi:hypothetical protein